MEDSDDDHDEHHPLLLSSSTSPSPTTYGTALYALATGDLLSTCAATIFYIMNHPFVDFPSLGNLDCVDLVLAAAVRTAIVLGFLRGFGQTYRSPIVSAFVSFRCL